MSAAIRLLPERRPHISHALSNGSVGGSVRPVCLRKIYSSAPSIESAYSAFRKTFHVAHESRPNHRGLHHRPNNLRSFIACKTFIHSHPLAVRHLRRVTQTVAN